MLFYGITVLLLAASLVVLMNLLRRFERDLETNVLGIQRVFSDENLLRTPNDERIRFAAIEDLASKFQDFGYFGRMTVTKFFGNEERAVYPFYLPALLSDDYTSATVQGHPVPGHTGSNVRMLDLSSNSRLLGRLYLTMDLSLLTNVRLAMGSLGLLLVAALAMLALQFKQQEQVISRTTVELEQKRREMVRLERLSMAGQLSANVFHDLRKPMLNIKNEMQEGEGTPGDANRRILDQVEFFFGILRDTNLERFVRSEGEREYVDVNDMIERSLALVRYERANVEIRKDLVKDLPPVLSETVRLIQVFSNLILNAYQAMQGRGVLTIATSRLPDKVCVSFADTGPGIPPGDFERIFTPFFTTKETSVGTGLGLYITREIVADLGGEIRVASTPGGAEFVVVLPAAS